MRTTSRDARLNRIRSGFPKPSPRTRKPQDPLEDDADFVTSLDTAGGAMRPSAVPVSAQSGTLPGAEEPDSVLRKIFTGNGMVIHPGRPARPDPRRPAHRQPRTRWSRPRRATSLPGPPTSSSAVWSAATGSYVALFQGSVFNPRGSGVGGQFAPLMETLTIATPLITAGLGVALAFRAGLFNIGAQGQIIMAGILAAWVGFALHLPVGLHLLLVLLAGIIGGAVWGGLVGVLKARDRSP